MDVCTSGSLFRRVSRVALAAFDVESSRDEPSKPPVFFHHHRLVPPCVSFSIDACLYIIFHTMPLLPSPSHSSLPARRSSVAWMPASIVSPPSPPGLSLKNKNESIVCYCHVTVVFVSSSFPSSVFPFLCDIHKSRLSFSLATTAMTTSNGSLAQRLLCLCVCVCYSP